MIAWASWVGEWPSLTSAEALRDRILLRGGDDQVRANAYTRDRDVIKGSSGFDLIYVDDGDTRDKIYGGKGRDKCYVDATSEAIQGCSRVIVR